LPWSDLKGSDLVVQETAIRNATAASSAVKNSGRPFITDRTSSPAGRDIAVRSREPVGSHPSDRTPSRRGQWEGESFVVTRNGVPVGELSPLCRHRFVRSDTAVALFRHAPSVDLTRLRKDLDRVSSQEISPRA
jgi:antitoxin (DNA-binding transcriptional repressor) of toxin-antitoxin stability system